MLHYPDDPSVYEVDGVFLYGRDFLVRPVVSRGVTEVSAYLPSGKWIHLWSGDEFSGGQTVRVKSPLGEPPVFFKAESGSARRVVTALEEKGLL